MRHSITTEYAIDDIPHDLANVALRHNFQIIVKKRWDGGCYRLRLTADYAEVNWEETFGDRFEEHPDFQIAASEEFDGGYNWDGLSTDDEDAMALLNAYIVEQRRLYPTLKLAIDASPAADVEEVAP